MTVGALVAAWHAFQPGWISSPGTHVERRRMGGAAGGLIAAVGIGLALAASLLHRQNAFDQYTASLLLATAAVAIIVGGRSLSLKGESGATLAAVMVVTALMHGLIWNPFLGARVTEWTLDINIRWELVAVISAVILGLAALGARVTDDEPTTAWRQTLSIWGSILAWIAIVAAFRHLPLHVGIGTALAAGAALALGLLAAAGGGEGLAFLCCVATAVVVGFGVAEVTIAQTQGQVVIDKPTGVSRMCGPGGLVYRLVGTIRLWSSPLARLAAAAWRPGSRMGAGRRRDDPPRPVGRALDATAGRRVVR